MGLLLPGWVKYLALALLVASVWGHGWQTGRGQVFEKWEAAAAKLEREKLDAVVRAAKVGDRVVTKYVDRVRVVRESASAVGRESHRVSADCPLSNQFARLHDVAANASGDLSGATGNADEAAPTVAADVGLNVIVDNYRNCQETAATLEALQQWAREVTNEHARED